MKGLEEKKICPACQFPEMKTWPELTEEERMLAGKLPLAATFSLEQRRKNYFCPRCWHEQVPNFNEFC
jgi:hypothetical protein